MILSNSEILAAIRSGQLRVGNLTGSEDPSLPPLNTTSIDLTLSHNLSIPVQQAVVTIDIRGGGLASYLAKNVERRTLTTDQPYVLNPRQFILAQTSEKIDLPIQADGLNLAARVEGRSSLARCGILVHFTAPTIHTNFSGTITLEMINFGTSPFLLFPGLSVCQLIVERVHGQVIATENQFKGQSTPEGT
jgi:dCTP deaminase